MTILKQRSGRGEAYAISEQIAHEVGALTIKVSQLQRVNGFLSRKLQLKPEVRQALVIPEAATMLVTWHLVGFRTGKRAALSLGMSNYTWYRARAFCMLGLIHNGRGFTSTDHDEMESGLRVAAERLTKNPDALQRYLPPSRRVRGGVRGRVQGGVR